MFGIELRLILIAIRIKRLSNYATDPDRPKGPQYLLSNVYSCCCCCPEVKRTDHSFKHSPPCRAEIKNEWSRTSAVLVCRHGVDRGDIALTVFWECELPFMLKEQHRGHGQVGGRRKEEVAGEWKKKLHIGELHDLCKPNRGTR
jgi:hypothetical protein